jgi:predicted RNase H-like HicB family nuclease
MELTAIISPANEGGFTSWNPETGSSSQGDTRDEALVNLIEATTLFLEEFPLRKPSRSIVTSFRVAR